ncbi:MAG: hypothetical protein MZU84_03845 [Sphingobacterium sp.]|nr:hypothetical protein [Sphingobacterium sp.]
MSKNDKKRMEDFFELICQFEQNINFIYKYKNRKEMLKNIIEAAIKKNDKIVIINNLNLEKIDLGTNQAKLYINIIDFNINNIVDCITSFEIAVSVDKNYDNKWHRKNAEYVEYENGLTKKIKDNFCNFKYYIVLK